MTPARDLRRRVYAVPMDAGWSVMAELRHEQAVIMLSMDGGASDPFQNVQLAVVRWTQPVAGLVRNSCFEDVTLR